VHTRDVSVRGNKSIALAERADRRSMCSGDKSLLSDAPGLSDIKLKAHVSGFVKRVAARILSAAPRAISLCMWGSFVDRRYSPSTGMDLSEWEIILDELIRMGYIVKEEPDSDYNE
jgi:hypothetical protein